MPSLLHPPAICPSGAAPSLLPPLLPCRYDELKRQLRDAELQAEAENDEMDYQQKATAAMAALGRSAAVVAPAAAAAAATALGAEVELAAAVVR